jgi:hypothetical protein
MASYVFIPKLGSDVCTYINSFIAEPPRRSDKRLEMLIKRFGINNLIDLIYKDYYRGVQRCFISVDNTFLSMYRLKRHWMDFFFETLERHTNLIIIYRVAPQLWYLVRYKLRWNNKRDKDVVRIDDPVTNDFIVIKACIAKPIK